MKQNVEKGYKEFWTHFFGGLECFFYGQKGDNCHWVEKVLVPKVFDKCNGREVDIKAFWINKRSKVKISYCFIKYGEWKFS